MWILPEAWFASAISRSNVVTASIDRMDFKRPAYVGDLLHFKASLNYVGKTSMEVGVRVEAENLMTGERRHTSTAYLTYVALDDNGKSHSNRTVATGIKACTCKVAS